jgi:hypothetical protein
VLSGVQSSGKVTNIFPFCTAFALQKGKDMNLIEEKIRPRKSFTVVVAYADFDSHGDKHAWPREDGEPDVWKVIVHATGNIEAITRAMQIVTVCRAEVMTNFMGPHPHGQHGGTFTLEEIEEVRQQAEDAGVFQHWLEMQPTSIQCHLTEDEGKLLDMTTNNINQMQESIGDQADDFLRNNIEGNN